MQELAIIIAKIMPEEFLIEEIEKNLMAHKLTPSKETRTNLGSTCMLFALQIGMEGKDLSDCLKEVKHNENVLEHSKDIAY